MENVFKKCDMAGGIVKMISPRVQGQKITLTQPQTEDKVPHHKKFSNSHFVLYSYGDTISKYKASIFASYPGFTASSFDPSVLARRKKDEMNSEVSPKSRKYIDKPKSRVYFDKNKSIKGPMSPIKLRINGIDVLGGKVMINPYRGPKYGSGEGLDHWTSTKLIRNYLAAEDFPVEKHKASKFTYTLPRSMRVPEYLTKFEKRKKHPLTGRHVKKERVWEVVTMKHVKKSEDNFKKIRKPPEEPVQKKLEPKKSPVPNRKKPKKEKKAKSEKKEPSKKKISLTDMINEKKKKEHRRLSDEKLYTDIGNFRSQKLNESIVTKRIFKPISSLKGHFFGREGGLRVWARGVWPALVTTLARAKQTWAERWFRKRK